MRRNAHKSGGCGAHYLCHSTPTPTLTQIGEQRPIKPTPVTNPTQASAVSSLTPVMASIGSIGIKYCFVFNVHCHDIICIVRTLPGQEAKVLQSREGITQGGVMGMTLYRIATTPLATQIIC